MARASSTTSHATTTILGKGTHVRGRVVGDGDLRVEGEIAGEVSLKGQLTIAEGAEITADVEARSVIVLGVLEGDVSATDELTVSASARVTGTLRGSSISVEEGATLSGRIEADFELPPELSGGKAGR